MWIKIDEVIVNLDNVYSISKTEYRNMSKFYLLFKFFNREEKIFGFKTPELRDKKFNELNKMIAEYYDCENQLKEL